MRELVYHKATKNLLTSVKQINKHRYNVFSEQLITN